MNDQLKAMTREELVSKRNEEARKFFDLRMQMVLGHVENPMQKRQMRRQIARLNTLIRQKELEQEKAGSKE